MRVLGVITARGGSKGIPRKNLVLLAGEPLIAHTIRAALNAKLLAEVVVSTEDEEIAEVSRSYGAMVPFFRPVELATDTSLSLPVVQHAIVEMEALTGNRFDAAMLLQPTSPLRKSMDIDACINLLEESDADSVVSVVEAPVHPFKLKRIIGDGLLINYIDQGFEDLRPRQMLPPVYKRSGDVYISRRSVLMEQDELIGSKCRAYLKAPGETIDIDSLRDFRVAEAMLIEQSSRQQSVFKTNQNSRPVD